MGTFSETKPWYRTKALGAQGVEVFLVLGGFPALSSCNMGWAGRCGQRRLTANVAGDGIGRICRATRGSDQPMDGELSAKAHGLRAGVPGGRLGCLGPHHLGIGRALRGQTWPSLLQLQPSLSCTENPKRSLAKRWTKMTRPRHVATKL